MTKLTVAFRNFEKAPKTYQLIQCRKIIADCQKSIRNTEIFYTLWLDVDV
jgi:hypothetical protein